MKKIIYGIVFIFCVSGCSLFSSNSNTQVDHDFDPIPSTWTPPEEPVHVIPDIIIITPGKTDGQVPMGKFGEVPFEKTNKSN